MEIGTEVSISKEMGEGIALVCGTMEYSANVVLIATDAAVGMPMNVRWLTPTGAFNIMAAARHRERYLALYPHTLR